MCPAVGGGVRIYMCKNDLIAQRQTGVAVLPADDPC